MSLFLLRYGELGLKAPGTRRRYEQRLAENLLERLTLAGIEARIEKMRGRFFAHIAESDDNNGASGVEPGSAADGATRRARNRFQSICTRRQAPSSGTRQASATRNQSKTCRELDLGIRRL